MPRAPVVDAMVQMAVDVCLRRLIFGANGFEENGFEAGTAGDGEANVHAFQAATCDASIDILPSPDCLKTILEVQGTLRLRKPFTPNTPPEALNPSLAKPIANARLSQ